MIMAYGSTFASLSVLAFDILSKATVLLTVVLLVDLRLWRYSAALRHRVLATAFFGLLVLPILSVVLPEYRIAILPAYRLDVEQSVNSNILETDSPAIAPPVPSVVFPLSSEQVASLAPSQLRPDEQSVVPNESATPTHQFSEVAVPPRLPMNGTNSGTAISRGGISTLGILGATWAFGIIATLSSFVLGIRKTSLLQRRSQRIDDQQLKNMLAELCRRLRIVRSITLIESEQAIVPMTWGLVRPFVLVPSAWRDWTQEQLRIVLLHELAHVKRLDVAYQAIARVACSLYWCHPLAWYAIKRLRMEREIACDDCVLMAGERPSQYAKQLLKIARECQWTEIPYAVSMAQPSQLENRIRSMLDPTRSHLPLTPKVTGGILALSFATLLLLSPIRLETLSLDRVDEKETINSKLEAKTSEAEQLHVMGVVASPDNLPLANVKVTVLRAIAASSFSEVHYEKLAETITDKDGRYEADVVAKSVRISDGFHFEEQRTIVLASKSGYGPDQVEVTPSIGSQNLQLAASTRALKGRILDQEGKPLQGIKIKLVKIEKAGSSIES
jgi:beta-lactamase regulating signal transducer with metallopeptidase domain